MTTINIVLHSYPESPRSLDQMLSLVRNTCDNRGLKYKLHEQTITYEEGIEEYQIKITLEDESQNSNIVDDFYQCKDLLDDNDNLQDYDELFPYDFTISVESSNINPVFERLRYRNELLNDQRAVFLTSSVSQLNDVSNNQEERLQAIEEYMKSSGIIYYQQFIDTLLERLSELNLVDIKKAREEFFETKH